MAEKKETGRQDAEGTKAGTVFGGSLNIRRGPSEAAEVTGVLADGASIGILETKDGWHRIKDGYVMARWVR